MQDLDSLIVIMVQIKSIRNRHVFLKTYVFMRRDYATFNGRNKIKTVFNYLTNVFTLVLLYLLFVEKCH